MKTLFLVIMALTIGITTNAQENKSGKAPYSPSIKAGNWVFISGQVALNPETSKLVNTSFEDEVNQVMENLKTQLKVHSLSLEDLVSTVIYIKDMDKYDLVNKVYAKFFNDKYPTRTCVAVKDLPLNASIEISGIAVVP